MELSNLTYLVVSCEMSIKKAKEQKENAVFECYPVKKDGSRALIGETELYINDLKAV